MYSSPNSYDILTPLIPSTEMLPRCKCETQPPTRQRSKVHSLSLSPFTLSRKYPLPTDYVKRFASNHTPSDKGEEKNADANATTEEEEEDEIMSDVSITDEED